MTRAEAVLNDVFHRPISERLTVLIADAWTGISLKATDGAIYIADEDGHCDLLDWRPSPDWISTLDCWLYAIEQRAGKIAYEAD